MECNREEALRAKEMAEKKMENKDFSAALKIAVKAQQLYPELENVSQMIVVCEVHISGEKKTFGTEKDWYAILKVEPSADEASIKKQYRKLALILHPDKNKFSGSTDAFKLIGEAQRILLDRDKRLLHDSKRRSFGKVSAQSWNPRQPSRQSNAQPHPWNQGHPVNFTAGRPGFQFTQQQQQQAPTGIRSTFWTVCPFCSVRYQFYRDNVLNKVINCQSCKKSFTAFELNAQSSTAATHTQTRQPHQQTSIPVNLTQPVFTKRPVYENPVNLKQNKKPQGAVNNRKRKKVVSESESSDSSSESEEEEEDVNIDDNGVPKNVDTNQYFGEEPRRSSRAKRNVSYKENLNDNDLDDNDDDDDAEKGVEDKFWKAEVKKKVEEDQKKDTENNNSIKNDNNKFPCDDNKERHEPNSVDKEEEDNTEEESEDSEPETFECPDPEFSNFDNNRKEESFSAGQLWACYDTDDAMPRFYAYIKKVVSVSPSFKLQIFWLKPDPVYEEEIKWVGEDLPVSCGRFTRGKNDKAEDLFSFSHLVSWETTRSQKGGAAYNIIPRKGETWALFKNWNINWRADEKRKYEYEFVEILSDYDENNGVRVSYLEKVKGFVSLFRPIKEGKETVIGKGSDKYRFAHMVPSVRMTGEERKGVPKGSYELDPAGLPQSIFEQLNL